MTKEIQIAQRLMLKGADLYLGAIPNVRRRTTEIKNDPASFEVRISEFHAGLDTLSKVISPEAELDRMNYFNVVALGNELEGKPIPTPEGIISSRDNSTISVAQDTFREIRQRVTRGEWQFPNEVEEQGKLTSGLLIEGYGLFLEKLYDNPRLSRLFVLALEEVLWNEFQDSNLLRDVTPWMIEERSEFAVRVEKGLEKLTPEYVRKQKRGEILQKAPLLQVVSNNRLMSTPYAGPAIKEASLYLHEDMQAKFGEKWEAAVIGGPLQVVQDLELLSADDPRVIQGVVETLFLIGYEVANLDKLSLFASDIIDLTKDAINKSAAEKYGATLVAKVLMSILHAGVNLRNRVDPKSIVDFNPGDDTSKQGMPKAFQDFLGELGFK
ncbi:hypothetical protein HYW42_05530 [Candidatus Daviesbacteria bacterium]|nr:hypothetical protein [Candidatus Daviesbacteria bacterium]